MEQYLTASIYMAFIFTFFVFVFKDKIFNDDNKPTTIGGWLLILLSCFLLWLPILIMLIGKIKTNK